MKNLIWIFSCLFAFSGCVKDDVSPDSFMDPIFFLDGEMNAMPFDIFAGGENHMTIFMENYMFRENMMWAPNLIGFSGHFRSDDFCQEDCHERLEIIIMAPAFDLNLTEVNYNNVFPIGSYEYDFLDGNDNAISKPTLVRIEYTDTSGDTYFSKNHLNPSSNKFDILEIQGRIGTNGTADGNPAAQAIANAQLTINFDCDLYNENNELLALRNMKGDILIGEFYEY